MTYPVTLTVSDDNKIANWRALVQWLLAIPHLIISQVIAVVAEVCAVIAWFAIVFTGKMPPGLAGIITMSLRYSQRATGYVMLLTEEYPPFEFETEFADAGTYPIALSVEPELENRNRLTVFFRLFMLIPHMIVGIVWVLMVYVLMIIAWFAVLFTGAFPEGMRTMVVRILRWNAQVNGYAFLLTDEFAPVGLPD